ncbi:MAG: TIGR01212 family radical SAM protein, partial [Muribaculaceae bacterium]|nr:TIGR01212 family radical SAM protein [Muribaculaceae bacterium]
MNPYYKDSAEYLSRYFGTCKVQKLSVNAGFSCPNRDGTIGHGGCSYCDNSTFTPAYCSAQHSVSRQLEEGKIFFGRKYNDMGYLAYFQSYTNTYGRDTDTLRTLYEEALRVQDVIGLVVGTRPDTLQEQVIEALADINRQYPVFVEIGAETSSDDTLRLVNRGHTWADTCSAVRQASKAGLHVGLHLIMGLPGETPERSLQSVADACELPIESLKLHQLQIIKGTPLHKQWLNGEIEIHCY